MVKGSFLLHLTSDVVDPEALIVEKSKELGVCKKLGIRQLKELNKPDGASRVEIVTLAIQ